MLVREKKGAFGFQFADVAHKFKIYSHWLSVVWFVQHSEAPVSNKTNTLVTIFWVPCAVSPLYWYSTGAWVTHHMVSKMWSLLHGFG